ncbi:MAG: hypothetical protein V1791_06815 [Pseudomonadota bacterium]
MKVTCTSCHTIMHLESALEEAAGREFTAFISGLGEVARPMVAYLGLFRPPTRALAYERMLRLAREVLALSSDNQLLARALSDTVEAIRIKRDEGDIRPLKNHNYLKQVLGNPKNWSEERGVRSEDNLQASNLEPRTSNPGPASKTAKAIGRLQKWREG